MRLPALLAALLPPLLLSLVPAVSAEPEGDTVVLTDKTTIRGRVLSQSAEQVRVRTDGKEFVLPRRIVAEVKLAPRAEAEETGKDDAPPDRLFLRDGGIVVGRIVEESKEGVTVEVEGRASIFPRGKILRIEWGTPKPLGPEAKKLALAAIARLVDENPAVRRSAYRTLLEMMPAVRPLLLDAAGREETPAEAKATLKSLLDRRSQEPSAPAIPGGAFRLLRDPESALGVLTDELELSNAQRVRVHEALGAAARSLSAAMEKSRAGSRDDGSAAIRELYKAFRGKMKKALTEAQFAKLEELIAAGGRPRRR